MKEIIARISNESPKFFKKIKIIGVALVGIGSSIAMAPIAMPLVLVAMSTHLITAGTIMTIVASCTVSDPEVLPKKD